MTIFDIPNWRVINLVSFVGIVIINWLANAIPLGGEPVGSGQESALLPATTAFAIWGLIYFLTAVFTIYQLLPMTHHLGYINRGIIPIFSVHAIGNMGWILCQAYFKETPAIQFAVILILLLSLGLMYYRVSKFVSHDLWVSSEENYYRNWFFGRAWLSVYTAWVVAASCVDGFHAFGSLSPTSYTLAAVVLGAIGVLAIFILYKYRDVLFGLTVVWTCYWLSVASQDRVSPDSPFSDPLFLSSFIVGILLAIGSGIALILNILFAYKRWRGANNQDQFASGESFAVGSHPSYVNPSNA